MVFVEELDLRNKQTFWHASTDAT